MTLAIEKRRLRDWARRRRKKLTLEFRCKAEAALTKYACTLLRNGQNNDCGYVGGYLPISNELDPSLIIERLELYDYRLALPVVKNSNAPLLFRAWKTNDPLENGAYGIRQPTKDALEVHPDILLVPLLAFDKDGYRLGWGNGYYDRTLVSMRVKKPLLAIGLAYAVQEVEQLPREHHDIPLDWIITEEGIIKGSTT